MLGLLPSVFLASLPTNALGWLVVGSAQTTLGMPAFFADLTEKVVVPGVALVFPAAEIQAARLSELISRRFSEIKP